MPDSNELDGRVEELEAELDRVLEETQALERRLKRRKFALRGITLTAALAFAACWALAAAAAGPGTTVMAPFEVVDEFDKPIFDVGAGARGFHLYRIGGNTASSGVVTDNAAFFKVGPDIASASVILAVKSGVPVMAFRYGGVDKDMIWFSTTGGSGRMVMLNTSGSQDILQLLTGPKGEGAMEINTAGGQLGVIAASSEGGFGRVEALPLGNPIGSAIVGRPKQ